MVPADGVAAVGSTVGFIHWPTTAGQCKGLDGQSPFGQSVSQSVSQSWVGAVQ